MENIHKVGKYGTEKTCVDESNSKNCIDEIYCFLKVHHQIDGYKYVIAEEIKEEDYYKRDGKKAPLSPRTIHPDSNTILLVNEKDESEFYVVISAEDKYQKTNGNAIERFGKNFMVFFDKLCDNYDICPYIMFCSGEGFMDKNENHNEFIMSKFREEIPYFTNWDYCNRKSIFKKNWNLIYFKHDRFTKEEKMDVMKNVVNKTIEYLRLYLNL